MVKQSPLNLLTLHKFKRNYCHSGETVNESSVYSTYQRSVEDKYASLKIDATNASSTTEGSATKQQ